MPILSPSLEKGERKYWGSSEWDLDILHCQVQLQNSANRFGEVVSGHLLVQGLTMSLLRSRQVVYRRALYPASIGTCQFDEPLSKDDDFGGWSNIIRVSKDHGSYLLTIENTTSTEPDDWDGKFDIDDNLYSENEYQALIIHLEDVPESRMKRGRGLLLLQRQNSGEYERIGSVTRIDISDTWFDLWKWETLTLV